MDDVDAKVITKGGCDANETRSHLIRRLQRKIPSQQIMKTTFSILGASLILSSASVCQGVLVTFSFATGASPDSQPTSATVFDMSRGSGLTADTFTGEFNAHSWTTDTARDLNDYYTFTITPNDGYAMTLTRLELDETRSGTGIRHWAIYSSLDSYGTALVTIDVPDNTSQRDNEGVDLSASFSGLSSAVAFRIYGYEAEGSGGTWHIDNVDLSGSLTAVPEPPEWGAISALGLLGICGLREWRQRRCGEKLKSCPVK